jgi:hypothetical protein
MPLSKHRKKHKEKSSLRRKKIENRRKQLQNLILKTVSDIEKKSE